MTKSGEFTKLLKLKDLWFTAANCRYDVVSCSPSLSRCKLRCGRAEATICRPNKSAIAKSPNVICSFNQK